jgi:hypothetical protein
MKRKEGRVESGRAKTWRCGSSDRQQRIVGREGLQSGPFCVFLHVSLSLFSFFLSRFFVVMADEAEAARIAQAVASLAIGAVSDDEASRLAQAVATVSDAPAAIPVERRKVSRIVHNRLPALC